MRHTVILVLLLASALGAACGDESSRSDDAPELLGLSASSVQVGHRLGFIGSNFMDPQDGTTLVRFDGAYEGRLGTYDVNAYEVRTARKNPNEVEWPYFGRFQVPFAPDGDEIGVFRGTVTPINKHKDGTEIAGEPLTVTLTVEPSIILYSLEPVVTQYACEKPSLRILGGYSYELMAATLGFPARSLTINITGEPGGSSQGRTITVPMSPSINDGSFGMIAEDPTARELVFAPVPDDATNYVATLKITATDTDNRSLTVTYPIPVHRPVALIPTGPARVAQIEQAVPVSGCMAGGINGQNVRYEETQSETRTRQVQYRWDTNWSSEKSSQTSQTTDWRNSTHTGWSDGGDHNWGINWSENANASIGVQGTIGGGLLPGSVSVHAETAYGKTWGGHDGGSRNWSQTGGEEDSYGESDTLTTTLGTTQGGSAGVTEFYDVSSTKSITSAVTGDVIPNMFGVWFRQVTRWSHPAAIVEFDLCGTPHVVANVEIADYQWAVGLGQGTDCVDVKPSLPEPVCYIGC